jgi:hypothetical protein
LPVEDNGMKHLLSGLGVAAVIAIAAPAWAQVPTTSRPPAEAVSVQVADAAVQRPARARAQRPMRAPAAARAPGGGRTIMAASPTDHVANDLNRQELQRLQAGPPAPMMAPPPPGAPGPRASGGGYITPSPPGAMPPSAAPVAAPRPSGGGYIPAPTGPLPMPPPPPISHPVR